MSALSVSVRTAVDPSTSRAIGDLLAAARDSDGEEPLGEHKRRELALAGAADQPSGVDRRDHAGPDHPRFAAVLAEATTPAGDHPVGYAQVSQTGGEGTWGIELVVHPAHRSPEEGVAETLLRAARDWASDHRPETGGPASVVARYWALGGSSELDRLARTCGFHLERELIQMRIHLPVPETGPPVETRAFVPGVDEEAWLHTNNRAFAGHPEQGGWDLATIEAREHEPWFDPDGFRVHEVGGRIVASCWTKVHRGTNPPVGEIYVISVDPEAHGRHLGRGLTLAGLAWLADQGIRSGMLYVDGSNDAAMGLYRSLGFTEHHVDRAYVLTAPPRPGASTGHAGPTGVS